MPVRRSRIVPATSLGELSESLTALRASLRIPDAFPADVLAEASAAAVSVPTDPDAAGLPDLRDLELITIDPPGSTDLDQALHLERTTDGAVLHYAIADVATYVSPDGALDAEARRRGQTVYAPDGRAPLHPPVISEGAASLLPDRDRRAYVWCFELDDRAEPIATTLTRAVVRSRAQWTYEDAQAAIDAGAAPPALAALPWFGREREQREAERGGASLNVPETSIVADNGTYHLERSRGVPLEDWNAHVSLLTGMAAARIMLDGGIGILRTMPPASPDDIAEFRAQTAVLDLPWPADMAYGTYLRTLPRTATVRAVKEYAAGLFRGAGYAAFDGDLPDQVEQAAIGAPYAHATAPLRRLVDRWSLVICEALTAGHHVPAWARESLPELPALMARSGQRASQLGAGALDRVEAAVLRGREGEVFNGVVLGLRADGARVQLVQPPAAVKVSGVDASPGSRVRLRLLSTDIATGAVEFAPA